MKNAKWYIDDVLQSYTPGTYVTLRTVVPQKTLISKKEKKKKKNAKWDYLSGNSNKNYSDIHL